MRGKFELERGVSEGLRHELSCDPTHIRRRPRSEGVAQWRSRSRRLAAESRPSKELELDLLGVRGAGGEKRAKSFAVDSACWPFTSDSTYYAEPWALNALDFLERTALLKPKRPPLDPTGYCSAELLIVHTMIWFLHSLHM